MDIYSTAAMLEVLRSLRVVPQFLLSLFFMRFSNSDRETILFDVEIDNVQVAPFVSPLRAGRIMRTDGKRTIEFKPAYVKPKHQIDPNEPLVREIGEPIGGQLSAAERENLILIRKLELQANMIRRRLEVMAAEALVDGRVTVEGEDYPAVVVDFGRHEDLSITKSGGARWGEAAVSPIADLETFFDSIGEKSSAAPNVCVMTADVWPYVRTDPSFKDMVDRTLGQTSAAELGFKPGIPGAPVYRGRLGEVELYTYNGDYEDHDGILRKLLPPHTVIAGSTGATEGVRHFGAIRDPNAGYQALEMYPRSWIENDPAVRLLMTQSAPMVAPRRPNATGRLTVR